MDKQLMRLILALLLAPALWSAAITSSGTGDWNVGGTWVGGAIPGDGDTVSIANTHTVTIPAGQTVTVGLGTGTSAIRLVSVTISAAGTCESVPTLAVTGGAGTQALVAAVLTGTALTGVTVNSHGWYSSAPTGITVGAGCSVPPTLTIAGGDTAAAVQAAISLNASGALVLGAGARLNLKGDIVYAQGATNTADAITFGAGATLYSDSPASIRYRFGAYNGNTGLRKAVFNGTAGSRITVTANPAGGEFVFGCGYGTYCGAMTADYVDFSRIGTAYDYGFEVETSATSDVNWNVQHSTFTNCGCVYSKYALNASQVFVHSYNTHRSTASSVCSLYFTTGTTAMTTGTRQIIGSYFDRILGYGVSTVALKDFTLTDSTLAGGILMSSAVGSAMASFQRNVILLTSSLYSYTDTIDNVFVSNDDATGHLVNLIPPATATVPYTTINASGNIFENTNKAKPPVDWGDCLLFGKWSQPALRTVNVTGNISLPSGSGSGSGTLVTFFSENSGTSWVANIDHNTIFVGTNADGSHLGGGRVALMEDTTGAAAGAVPSLRSNIAWNDGAANNVWMADVAIELDLITAADYNLEYGIKDQRDDCAGCTNQRYGYGGAFTNAPGTNDKWNVNPQFVDPYRVFGRFSASYLGKSATNGAWTTGQTYTTGQTVTHAASTYYANTTMLYRRNSTAGAEDATTEPGVGASWRTHWDLATIADLGDWYAATSSAGLTISNGAIGCATCSPAEAMVKWVRAGYAPTNPLLKNAGHDGVTIGAVGGVFASGGQMFMQVWAGW